MEDSYYFKLRYSLKNSYQIKENDSFHFSDLFIDSKNYIYRFGQYWVPDKLYLLVIEKIHDQIMSSYSGYEKTISLLARNGY